MLIEKPSDVFDRVYEWDDLVRFVTDDAPGLRIGIVRGRRRQGKSFLLEHLCERLGGVYSLALRESRGMAQARFSDAISSALGRRMRRSDDWLEVLDIAIDMLAEAGGDPDRPPLLVLDEFPYLVAHSPELPSAIQALYDQRGPSTGHPPVKLILCGSAVSVMSTLLAGDQALRGRAVLDMRMRPFLFRDAAAYWGCEPAEAFLVDAIVGGAPGYRDVARTAPEPGAEGIFAWLERTVFNPSHALFTEPDYLLAEDPVVGDRAMYYAVWQAVSEGATTPTRIAGLVRMDVRSLTYHLGVMRDAGFIRYDEDVLLRRRPVITVADPVVRFHHLIVRPQLAGLERRRARAVWDASRDTFSAKIVGPHFEELAREWVKWYGEDAGLDDVSHVGTTGVSCREHRGHQVDVIAMARESWARHRGSRITVLGEAKATARPRGIADLQRLEHIRDLLAAQGWVVSDVAFALFSRNGFDADLRAAAAGSGRVHLVDLSTMYGVGAHSPL